MPRRLPKLYLALLALTTLSALAQQTVPLHVSPQSLIVNPALNRVYVSDFTHQSFDIYDAAANTVTNIATPGRTYSAVACNPTTGHVFAADSANNAIVAMDADGNITSTHPTGNQPRAVAIDSNAGYVYILNSDKTLTILNGNSLTTSTVNVGASSQAILLVNPLTHRAYVANTNDNTVTVISGANIPTASTVTVGTTPIALALNPITNKIYVANADSNTVTIIDGATNATTSVAVGSSPTAIAVDPTTNKAFVAHIGTSNVTVLTGASVTATIAVGNSPAAIAVDPNTATIYVSSQGDSLIDILDETGTISSGQNTVKVPEALASNPITSAIFSALTNSSSPLLYVGSYIAPFVFNPIVSTLTGVVDSNTVTNSTTFETKSSTPSFKATALSTYASTSPYATSNTAANPAITSFYFQLDSTTGPWTRSIPTQSSAGAAFTITLPATAPGNHTLYFFSGYGNEGGQGQMSPTGAGNSPETSNVTSLPFLIDGTTSSLLVSADINPQLSGHPINFTATLSPATATGTVSFTDTFGATITPLGTATITNGIATLATSLTPVGSHLITANYSGDNTYNPASATYSETIYISDTTTTALIATPSTITLGDSSNLAATVTDTITPATVVPGTVTFYDTFNGITTTIIQRSLATHTAGVAYTPTAVGTHNLTASFTPNDNTFLASTGTATLIVQTIVVPPPPTPAPSFTFTLIGASQQPVDSNGNATFTFALAPSTGNIYPSDIHFSAVSSFTAIDPAFSPSTTTQNSGAQTVTLTIRNAPHLSSNQHNNTLILTALLLLPLLRLRRARKLILPFLALILATNTFTGCGWGVRFYPINVTASSTTQTIPQTISVRLME